MKVIDLFNKIANGELPPQRIKFKNYIYVWRNHQKDYFCKQINRSLESIIGERLFNNLNLEIEIIEEVEIIESEEDKKIAKFHYNNLIWEKQARDLDYMFKEKINEIIDIVNELKGKSK